MSTMQRISMIGLYNYDSTIFDKLTLPEGYSKETFINSLLLEHGEKLALYTDPDFMKSAIGIWSNKWALELSRIYEGLTAEYNPIYNYDRFEQIEDSEGVTSSAGHKATDSPTLSTENTISADNASGYQPDNKTTLSGKARDLSESSNGKTDRTYSHGAHIFGNIGVTTSAQMVTEVVKQRLQYNLYSIATNLFASELLIGIY